MSARDEHLSVAQRHAPRRTWASICTAVVMALVAVGCAEAADPAAEPTSGDATEQAAEPTAGDAATQTQSATEEAVAADCDGAAELEGEELEIAVPFSAGGGFDRQARLIGDALAQEFGVTSVVVNETGAGGLVSLNQHTTTDPEKLRIQYVQTPSAVAAQIAGAEGAPFSLEEWPWIGRVMVDPQLAVASVDSGFTSLEDVFSAEPPARFAATGPGGIDYLHAKVLPDVFNSEVELITGFGSTEEVVLSLANGDIDVYVLSERALLPAVEAGDAVALALLTREESANLPDVPLASELVEEGTEEAELLENYINLVEIGRSFAAVPGAEQATIDTLSCMLETVLMDEEFVEVLEQEGDEVAYASGPEVQEFVAQAVGAGGQFAELLKESF